MLGEKTIIPIRHVNLGRSIGEIQMPPVAAKSILGIISMSYILTLPTQRDGNLIEV